MQPPELFSKTSFDMLISPVSANDRSIPAVKIEEESKEIIETRCRICFETFDEAIFKLEMCEHFYHK